MEFINQFIIPIVNIAIVTVVAIIAHHLLNRLIGIILHKIVRTRRHETKADSDKRADTLSAVFGTTGGFLIWIIAAIIILGILKFDIAPIATGAGFLGIIIGLGAQATIRDYLAGISILLENQYRVGDIVTLTGGSMGMGTSGVVEEITLRITKLRDLDGTLNIVRNGEASVITNRTFIYSSVVIDIGITYDSDIDKVEKVMNAVGKSMVDDEDFTKSIEEPIQFLRVDQFTESAVIIKAVGKVKPAKQWAIAGEYRRRILKEFKKEEIRFAYPQVVIHQAKS